MDDLPQALRRELAGSFRATSLSEVTVNQADDGLTTKVLYGLDGGYASVKGSVSSQFLSGLLMALPYARESTTVEIRGALVSQPYVTMTLAVMEAFGVTVGNRRFRRFDVRPEALGVVADIHPLLSSVDARLPRWRWAGTLDARD